MIFFFFLTSNFNFYKNYFLKNFFVLYDLLLKNYINFFLKIKNSFFLNFLRLDFFYICNFLKKNKVFNYNNQYPIFIFKSFFKSDVFINKKKIFGIKLFLFYLNFFFEFFFKNKIFIKSSSQVSYKNVKILQFFFKNNFYVIKYYKFFNYLEMCEILLLSLINKDLIFFKNWFSTTLNNISVKNHKKFFILLTDFVSDNFVFFSNFFNVSGFYFYVKGKIGLAGNAKKKTFFFRKGSIKLSSKHSKIDFQKFSIKTNCGSLGINFIISY